MKDATSLGNRRLNELDRGRDRECLTRLADAGTLFQKGHGSTGQATPVHEFIADRAARPAATKEGDVAI